MDRAVCGLVVRAGVDVSSGHYHAAGGRGGRAPGAGRGLRRGGRDGGVYGPSLGLPCPRPRHIAVAVRPVELQRSGRVQPHRH